MPRLLSLDQSGELTSAHVKLVATAVGRSERAVWRWVAEARATGQVDAASRTRLRVTPELRRLLVVWGGNASAVHRELKQRAFDDPRLPAAPSLSTLHRALRRDLTPGERAGLAKGEAARRAFDVFGQRPPAHRNAAWEGEVPPGPWTAGVYAAGVRSCLSKVLVSSGVTYPYSGCLRSRLRLYSISM